MTPVYESRSVVRGLCVLLLIASGGAFACETGRVGLVVLGSGGPEVGDGRASSGYLVRLDGVGRVLVDAGAGPRTGSSEREGAWGRSMRC